MKRERNNVKQLKCKLFAECFFGVNYWTDWNLRMNFFFFHFETLFGGLIFWDSNTIIYNVMLFQFFFFFFFFGIYMLSVKGIPCDLIKYDSTHFYINFIYIYIYIFNEDVILLVNDNYMRKTLVHIIKIAHVYFIYMF